MIFLMNKLIELLKNGGIAIIPTDTIYGIVGSALNPQTVEEIYNLRKRALNKPMIILISSLDDLKKIDVKLTDSQREFLQKHWPNPLSVVLPCPSERFRYLHRGTKSLAFRMPKDGKFLGLLQKTGPLVAPSANFEGEKYAETINEARESFGDKVDFYLDMGRIKGEPSTLIRLEPDGKWNIIRQGKFHP